MPIMYLVYSDVKTSTTQKNPLHPEKALPTGLTIEYLHVDVFHYRYQLENISKRLAGKRRLTTTLVTYYFSLLLPTS